MQRKNEALEHANDQGDGESRFQARHVRTGKRGGRNLKNVKEGDFIEIYCDCSLEVCESRDVKGIYARARRGEIPEFTGISAPYEIPKSPEVIINTENLTKYYGNVHAAEDITIKVKNIILPKI